MLVPLSIFVSHTHKDNVWCRVFVAALRQAGADVWYDEHNMGANDLTKTIEREIRAHLTFIAVLSPASIASRWVQREITAAIRHEDNDRERKILFVLAEKCDVPLLWSNYRRVCGEDDAGLPPKEAAQRTVRAFANTVDALDGRQDQPLDSEGLAYDVWGNAQKAHQAWKQGQRLLKQGFPQDALTYFNEALELFPNHTRYLWSKAAAMRAAGRDTEAIFAEFRARLNDLSVGRLSSARR